MQTSSKSYTKFVMHLYVNQRSTGGILLLQVDTEVCEQVFSWLSKYSHLSAVLQLTINSWPHISSQGYSHHNLYIRTDLWDCVGYNGIR